LIRLALLASLLLLSACNASEPQEQETVDDEFAEKVRAVLMERPEIMLEALEAYRARMEGEAMAAQENIIAEQRAAVAGSLDALLSAQTGNAVGAPASEADLVIVEFFDYQCGFCRQAVDQITELTDGETDVRVIFQELPLLGPQSREAALVSLAAGDMGADTYRRVHRALMQNSGPLTDEKIDRALARAGVDAGAIRTYLDENEEKLLARLRQSIGLAESLKVEGTPFFLVYDPESGDFDVMPGYHEEMLTDVIESVRG
jgi:protein-disulfide isomerase